MKPFDKIKKGFKPKEEIVEPIQELEQPESESTDPVEKDIKLNLRLKETIESINRFEDKIKNLNK